MKDAPYAAHPANVLILTLILSPVPATCARGQGNSLHTTKQQHVENVNSRLSGQPSSDPVKANSSYIIGPGDLLAINVLHEPEVSQRIPVRMDGKISMPLDRKSTRLNSSHANISYAVFCLKKKKNTQPQR